MSRADKTQAVAELAEQFRSATGVVLTDYRGLTVSQLQELRRCLSGSAKYAIVKNTLTKLAVDQAGVPELSNLLVGPSAVAFVTGDVVEAAKGLKKFAKEHPALVLKGGHFEGRALTAQEVSALAELESRDVLLAKLAGAMKASMANAASLFAAPLSQAARTFDALRVKKEAEAAAAPEAEPAAPEAPAAAEAPEAPAAPEAAAEEAPPETEEAPPETEG